MNGLLIGSIGTLIETSDMQRQAFNAAFREAGLDWDWSADAYAAMLLKSGGRDRIAAYAAERGVEVDADALHARKSEIFQKRLLSEGAELRPGVGKTLGAARTHGLATGFVTTTSERNVLAVLEAAGLDGGTFDLVVHAGHVETAKPTPEAYLFALEQLNLVASETVAVEDNPDGARAARAAHIPTLAFPGAMHDEANFEDVAIMQGTLDLSGLLQKLDAAE